MTVLAGTCVALAGSIFLQPFHRAETQQCLPFCPCPFMKSLSQGICSVNIKCMHVQHVQSDHHYLSHATHERAPGVSDRLMFCSQVGCYVTHTCQQGSW